ncbi:hypothetical protein F511_09485 [Dorcoceras hygrometricum]|uniref:Uncharacterized protein n=1 Tax=Dorcoceras hygrometricum TaxID=472368 RepID=A0A2Z7CWQ9_9LAMI|nr:hypothetical protein F511_09485 [Dorcoceras hygrometricum]
MLKGEMTSRTEVTCWRKVTISTQGGTLRCALTSSSRGDYNMLKSVNNHVSVLSTRSLLSTTAQIRQVIQHAPSIQLSACGLLSSNQFGYIAQVRSWNQYWLCRSARTPVSSDQLVYHQTSAHLIWCSLLAGIETELFSLPVILVNSFIDHLSLRRRRRRLVSPENYSGQLDEENPSAPILSGLLVQADEGVSHPVVDLIDVVYRHLP